MVAVVYQGLARLSGPQRVRDTLPLMNGLFTRLIHEVLASYTYGDVPAPVRHSFVDMGLEFLQPLHNEDRVRIGSAENVLRTSMKRATPAVIPYLHQLPVVRIESNEMRHKLQGFSKIFIFQCDCEWIVV